MVFLVDDHVVAHELEEALHVHDRVDSRNLVLLPVVKPNLDQVFCFLLDVESLKVVDDRDVVDVLAVLRNELVPVVQAERLEIFGQFAGLVGGADLADRLDVVRVRHELFNHWVLDGSLLLLECLLAGHLFDPLRVRFYYQK